MILSLLPLTPLPAWAEVCAEFRPNWDGTPATAISEAVQLFITVPSVALLVATALAFRLRHQWLALGVVVVWTIYASILAFLDADSVRELGMIEGCVGPSSVFIGLVGLLSLGLIFWTAPRASSE